MSEARATRITIIPQRLELLSGMPIAETRKRRVTAYARVSTDSEEQLNSYEAQKQYYTEYIQKNPDYEYIGIYADEGITGTSTHKRKEFNRMVEDAVSGKIDLIVTKSIARFARNTVDTLTIIRMLREHGVEVFFENQNISSFDPKCEFLISVMASIAQEESRNISQNVTWGMRKRAAEGRVYLPYKTFLGFTKGEDGRPEIDEEGAELALQICRMFLDGLSYGGIAKELTALGVPTPFGMKKWSTSTVESVIFNEKRRGDALLMKTYTVDYLTHRTKVNQGEVEQYFVENSHPAIFSRELSALLDMERERRQQIGKSYNGAGIFSSRIVCGNCGGIYGPKVWYSNTKYRRTIWRCNRKYAPGEETCSTPHLREEEIVGAFLVALKQQAEKRPQILEGTRVAINSVLDTAVLEQKREELDERLEGTFARIHALIKNNAREVIEQGVFLSEHNKLSDRCAELTFEIEKLDDRIGEMRGRKAAIDEYIAALEQVERLPVEFSRRLWNMTVETLTVFEGKRLVFQWKDGTTTVHR